MKTATLIILALACIMSGCSSFPSTGQSRDIPAYHDSGDTGSQSPKTQPDRPIELEYRSISKWLFVAGLIALFFRHNWGAGCAFAGAVIAPVVGRMTDTLIGLSTYLVFGALALGFIAAWYVISHKMSLPDDGNLFTWAKEKFAR